MVRRAASQMHFIGLVSALVLLATIAMVAGVSWREFVVGAGTAASLRANIAHLQGLLINVRAAESIQRGYLLTHKPQYLKHFSEAVYKAQECIRMLPGQTPFDPDYPQQAVAELRAGVTEKLGELQWTVKLVKTGQTPAAMAVVDTDQGQLLMERLSDLEQSVELEQTHLLESTRNRIQHSAIQGEVTAMLGCIGILVIVLLSSVQIHRLIATRDSLSAELSRAADEFRILADSVPQFVWRRSDTGELTYVNEEWVRFSGLPADRAPGEWQKLLHPDDRDDFLRVWESSLQPDSERIAQCRMRDASGKYRWLLFRGKPVANERLGRQWYCTFTDIESQKASEVLLQQANNDLLAMGFASARDLQEPLRNVSLVMEMLIQNCNVQPDDNGRSLDAQGNAQRMLGMIRDLIAYNSIFDSPRDQISFIDSEICVRHALARLDEDIREAGGAQIRWDGLPSIKIHQEHLIQLFQHLIGNAVKYRKPNTKPVVQICAVQQGLDWLWTVSDQGIGFDPVYAERIFRIFKRLHHDHEYCGSGVGLAICERIVTFHGGRIWAESVPHKGSSFKFLLAA